MSTYKIDTLTSTQNSVLKIQLFNPSQVDFLKTDIDKPLKRFKKQEVL